MKEKTLHIIEKIAKTDARYLIKGGFWLSFSNAINLIFGLVLSIAFANFLPAEIYGNYRFVLSGAGIIGAFTLSGMALAVSQAAAKKVGGILKHGFITKLKWSIGVFLMGLGVSIYYLINENTTLAFSFLIVGSLSPFLESSKLYNSYLSGRGEFRKNALLGFFRKIIPTFSMLIALLLTNNVIILVGTFFITNTIVLLSIYFKTVKELGSENIQKKDLDTVTNFSKHLSLMKILGTISGNIDKVLIFHYLGAAELALYAFATLPGSKLQIFSNILQALILPKLTTTKIETIKNTLPRKVLISTIGMALIIGVYIILAPYIFYYLFPQYIDGVIISQLFALTFITKIPTVFFSQTLIAHTKHKELYLVKTTSPIIRILLYLIFLPIYGIWGALIAITISNFFHSSAYYLIFKRLKTN